jgi:hypothetical protein
MGAKPALTFEDNQLLGCKRNGHDDPIKAAPTRAYQQNLPSFTTSSALAVLPHQLRLKPI